MIFRYLTFSAAAFFIILLTGCTASDSDYVNTDKKEFYVNASGKSKLRISESRGEIRVTGSDSINMITISAKIFLPDDGEGSKTVNDKVKIVIDTLGPDVVVKTEYDKGFLDIGNSGYADYDVIIPGDMKVDINSVNGDIYLTSVDSESCIETVNSNVYIFECPGKIEIDGVNSDIISNFNTTNGVNISVVNGDIKLGGMKNIAADVKISTLNGDVSFKDLTFSNIEINGKKSFKGSIGNGGRSIKVSTVNGDIRLDANYINSVKK